jgi:hypothetical protein
VDTKRFAADVDAIEAVGCTDTGADILFATRHQLLHDQWICDMCTHHADHVYFAARDGVACGRYVGNLADVKDRNGELLADLSNEIEMGCGRPALYWNNVGERRVGIDMPANNVQKIDIPVGDESSRDLHTFLTRDTNAGPAVIVIARPALARASSNGFSGSGA